MENDFKTVLELSKHFDVTIMSVYKWIQKGMPFEERKQVGRKKYKIISLQKAKDFLGV